MIALHHVHIQAAQRLPLSNLPDENQPDFTPQTDPMDVSQTRFLPKTDLQILVDLLIEQGYEVIAPAVEQEAIVLKPLDSIESLPWGCTDRQSPAVYQLEVTECGQTPERADASAGNRMRGKRAFDFNVGPGSWKSFLFPPRSSLMTARLDDEGWHFEAPETSLPRYAFLGVRACDLAAIEVQDRVFRGDLYQDPQYVQLRDDALIIVIECAKTSATCFCHSWGTGPDCDGGFDLAMTELDDGFLIAAGSDRGDHLLSELDLGEASTEHRTAASEQMAATKRSLSKSFDPSGVREMLLQRLEHPAWDQVAERCLSCTNCTLVCPTCFCSSVDEVSDLVDDSVSRVRQWDSCFNLELSYTCGGTARPNIRSRYRQWLTHKLATWHDQFDVSGCVGCGRCITWCPVGIDLTEEVQRIGETAPQ